MKGGDIMYQRSTYNQLKQRGIFTEMERVSTIEKVKRALRIVGYFALLGVMFALTIMFAAAFYGG